MPVGDRFYLEYKLDVMYTFTYKGKDVFMLFPKVEWTAIDLTEVDENDMENEDEEDTAVAPAPAPPPPPLAMP